MKVKICGITRLEDALRALDCGADLLGFNFYPPSPRCLSLEACAAITAELRRRAAGAALVGVFVNPTLAEVELTLRTCDLDLAQFHGDEPPELLRALDQRAFKALRPFSREELQAAASRLPERAAPPAALVDASRPGAYGGTGQTANWGLAALLAQQIPILLAGGLTPLNVRAAIQEVHPWGVDVASGVESAPGIKDPARVEAFIRAAKAMK